MIARFLLHEMNSDVHNRINAFFDFLELGPAPMTLGYDSHYAVTQVDVPFIHMNDFYLAFYDDLYVAPWLGTP